MPSPPQTSVFERPARVARIWRTEVDPARADEYEEFARTISLPTFRGQSGFVAALFARDGARRAVITIWESWESVEALGASATYRRTVEEISAAGFLRGEQETEVYALDGFYSGAP